MSLSIIFTKLVSIFLSIAALLGISFGQQGNNKNEEMQYANVFVNGLMGWGEYDFYYDVYPYWGMNGGDMLTKLRDMGYEVYGASVNGIGSTWDRACELYAQLTGTVVDYGEAHSAQYGHARYGADYTENRLIKRPWSETEKVNLYGHSFGGATIRLLAYLMEHGSQTECAATPNVGISGLFTGGKGNWVNCVFCLSAPHNGSASYEAASFAEDEGTCISKLTQIYDKIDPTEQIFNMMVALCADNTGKVKPDTAHYELTIDNAMALNRTMGTVPGVYYFSVATCCTTQQSDGTWMPRAGEIEPLFYTRSIGIGKNSFVTAAGYTVDESWWANDGLVSVVSAHYPFGEAHTEYSFTSTEKPSTGIWNVLPDFWGDHTSLIGDIIITKDNTDYYVDAINMVNSLS